MPRLFHSLPIKALLAVVVTAILVGIVLGQAFFAWSHRRVANDKRPLLAMEVLDSREEKSAVIAFLVAGSLGLAVGFLIPLYVQIVQDRTPLASAGAILPYAIAIAAAGVFSVRLYDRFSPRRLGVTSFVLVAAGCSTPRTTSLVVRPSFSLAMRCGRNDSEQRPTSLVRPCG